MRLLIYNIRYGAGGRRRLLPWVDYLRLTRQNLERITTFIASTEPDIIGLLEVDSGSYRSGRVNQAERIAGEIGHYHVYRSKYAERATAQRVPVMNKQGNAFLCRDAIRDARFHYFDRGVKRLVLELELAHVTLFLVHLSLRFRTRHRQLSDLYAMVKDTTGPYVVAGDFNSRTGEREIRLFLAATKLTNPNAEGSPSFPSWAPRRHLDFILHTPDIRTVDFKIPPIAHSDHLPLVWDFVLAAGGTI